MKYLGYTLIIVLALILGAWLTVTLRPTPKADANDLVINQRIITANEIDMRRNDSPYHFEGEDAFLEDLITRELLIQEARRQNIDQEEPFRKSLQNYFEQSLLKNLLDRQYQKISKDLKQSELDRFRNNLKNHFSLKISHYPNMASAMQKREPLQQTTASGSYLELSETLRDAVSNLAPGETSAPIQTGSTCFRVTLKEKKPIQRTEPTDHPAAFIREAAVEEQQRQAMQKWLNDLREKARISLPASNLPQGE